MGESEERAAALTDLEEARQLVVEQFAPMFEASRLASASAQKSASTIVEALDRLTAAVEAHTKQVESSTFDVVTELKFIGTQLTNMYTRHFDTV